MNTLEMILEEIDNIEKEYDTERYHQYFVDGASCVISDIRALIRSRMNDAKDLNVPTNDGWIPVSDRLPEVEKIVLVTCEAKNGRRSINRAWCDGVFWHGSGSMAGVIAWMELPEPYKIEETKDA